MKIKTKYEFSKKTSGYFMEEGGHDFITLLSQQRWLNDKLRIRGYVFLNDVLEALDMKLVSYGYRYGWVRGNDIDFGLSSRYLDSKGKLDCTTRKVIIIEMVGMENIEKQWFEAYNSMRIW